MDLGLVGRRALVTGGSRGIGRGIVRALASEGASVVFCGRNEAVGEGAAQSLRGEGLDVRFVAGDVENDAAIDALALEVAGLGPVEILVNNVGGSHNPEGGARDWVGIPSPEWEKTFYKCVVGAVRLSDAVLPAMRARGWGRIVNISSVAGLEPGESVPADYSAAKAAMNTMTQSLSRALASTGVTVNAVSPGPVLTEGLKNWVDLLARERGWTGDWSAIEKRFVKDEMRLTVDRLGRPEDIGRAVAFLAGTGADFITGTNLRIDGGLSRAAI
jgi:3-oxoacyl-[acyl-carrier protein] reductase